MKAFTIVVTVLLVLFVLFGVFAYDNFIVSEVGSLNNFVGLRIVDVYDLNNNSYSFLGDCSFPVTTFEAYGDLYGYVTLYYGDKVGFENYRDFRIFMTFPISSNLNVSDIDVIFNVHVGIENLNNIVGNYRPEIVENDILGGIKASSVSVSENNGNYYLNLSFSQGDGVYVIFDFNNVASSFSFIYEDLKNSEPYYTDESSIIDILSQTFVEYPRWLFAHLKMPFQFFGFNLEVFK